MAAAEEQPSWRRRGERDSGQLHLSCIVVGILYFWMKSQQCFSPRDNNTTERLKQMRALRSLQKLEEEEP